MRKTRNALVISIMALVMCVAVLAGTTYAWFTDSAANDGNNIKAGKLKVDVAGYIYSYESGANPYSTTIDFIDANPTPLITEENWKPGTTATRYIGITNNGTLALDYQVSFVVSDNGLMDALWYTAELLTTDLPTDVITRPDFPMGAVSMRNLSAEAGVKGTALAENETEFWQIDYGMLQEAGNEYMEKDFSATIVVTAIQSEATVVLVRTEDDLKNITAETLAKNPTVSLLDNVTLTADMTFTDFVNLDLNGYTLDLGGFTLKIDSDELGTVDISKGTIIGGTIEIDAPNAVIHDYATYKQSSASAPVEANIVIIAVANSSYHFHGIMTTGTITIKAGSLVCEANSTVYNITKDEASQGSVKAITVYGTCENGGTIDSSAVYPNQNIPDDEI